MNPRSLQSLICRGAAAIVCAVVAAAPTHAAVLDFIVDIQDQPVTPGGIQFAFDVYIQLNPDEFTGNRPSGFRGIEDVSFNAINTNLDSFAWNPDLELMGYSLSVNTVINGRLFAGAGLDASDGVFNLGLEDITVQDGNGNDVVFLGGVPLFFGSGVYTPTLEEPLPVFNRTASGTSVGPAPAARLWDGQGNFGFATGVTRDLLFQDIPEPASLALLGMGALCMFGRRRRRFDA